MKNLRTKLIFTAFLTLLVAFGATAQPASDSESTSAKPDLGNLRAFIELARADVKTQKALILAQNLTLTDDEAVEFWPLQRDYETELSKLNDQKFALIRRYAETYLSMTDRQAAELAQGSFKIEEKKTSLKRKYFKKFQKVIPATKATRFFQIENQLNMALDLQVAASLPLIK